MQKKMTIKINMLVLNKIKEHLKQDMDCFIWNYKISDNILYNLEVLFSLIDGHNNLKNNFQKPISIVAVSIVEAIMVDLLYRLYHGTNHFPVSLKHREAEIKRKINEKTKDKKIVSTDGKEYYCSILKNFNFAPMITLYRDLNLLGNQATIYDTLLKLSYFRNRVHINNYYDNFEKDEKETFSEKRTQTILDIMIWFFTYFKKNYSRPWPSLCL